MDKELHKNIYVKLVELCQKDGKVEIIQIFDSIKK